jgi:hypothetical protein
MFTGVLVYKTFNAWYQQKGSQQIYGHRFVLAARSDYWGLSDLSSVKELDLTGIVIKV